MNALENEQACSSNGEDETDYKEEGNAFPQEQARADSDKDGREISQQCRVGHSRELERPMPHGEISHEEEPCDRQPFEVCSCSWPSDFRMTPALPTSHEPQQRKRKENAKRRRGTWTYFAETNQDGGKSNPDRARQQRRQSQTCLSRLRRGSCPCCCLTHSLARSPNCFSSTCRMSLVFSKVPVIRFVLIINCGIDPFRIWK
jgi:hypothetical protein